MQTRRGFSVIELLVSIAVGTVLLAVVVTNYYTSNDKLAIQSAAQELSIVIRQAQAYGLAVKESVTGSGAFTYAYGVYFNYNSVTNASTYQLFVDRDNDNFYDVGSGTCGALTTECVETLTLRNGIKISAIHNSLSAIPAGATSLNITFKRPNPDAVIYFKDNSGTTILGPTTRGKVILTSPRGTTATISVDNTGQILIQ